MLFAAFVRAIQNSKYILLACCETVITPPEKTKHYSCWGMNPALSLFLLTCLPWVLHCKTVMAMGPHSLQLCFLYLPSSIVKIFCGCWEDQFLADYTLEIPTQ